MVNEFSANLELNCWISGRRVQESVDPGLYEGTLVAAAQTRGHVTVVAVSVSYLEGRKDAVRGRGSVIVIRSTKNTIVLFLLKLRTVALTHPLVESGYVNLSA